MTQPAFWRGKTVLVTGATGFLGGWLAARLLDYGATVVATVRRDRPSSQFAMAGLAARCRVVTGDNHDPATIAAVFRDHAPDAVFHTAAMGDVNECLRDPLGCYKSNIDSTLYILEAIRTKRPACIAVVSSSDKAYGPQEVPYRESQSLKPNHPYEVSKAAQDLMAQSHGRVFGLPVAVTRCANYYGGWDFNWTRIIPYAIRCAIRGETVKLRSDGRFTRDFLYIEDAVDVQLSLAEAVAARKELRGEAFNFSYEIDIEIIEIVRRIGALMNVPLEPEIKADAKAEIRYMAVNADKARAMLGWKPLFTFEDGLLQSIEWYRAYLAKHPAS